MGVAYLTNISNVGTLERWNVGTLTPLPHACQPYQPIFYKKFTRGDHNKFKKVVDNATQLAYTKDNQIRE